MNYTQEQLAIISAVTARKDVMVIARAGCAKTTTIIAAANALPPEIQGLALAFNKKIQQELEKKLPPNIKAITLNALGHRAWAAGCGKKLFLEAQKLQDLLTKTLSDKRLSLDYSERKIILDMVNNLRELGAVPPSIKLGKPFLPWEEALELAWETLDEPDHKTPDNNQIISFLLEASIKSAFNGTIDFNDQIYMPVVFGGIWPNPEVLFVDEAQDLSGMNHVMVQKCRADQLVVVGDPLQAIYAFRGALSDSMPQFAKLREFETLKLTTTFRCGKAIVARAQAFVPDFTAHNSNPEGKVDFLESWTFKNLPRGSAILSRNNAPLIRIALKLIRAKIPASIIGRDIARGLVRDIKKACPQNKPIVETMALVRDFYNRRIELKPSTAPLLNDRYEAIFAAGDDTKDTSSLVATIEKIFDDDPSGFITLATGHKAKGLEWDTVFHLDPFLIPFKGATGESLQQEYNLRYVIETRAKSYLGLIETKGLVEE